MSLYREGVETFRQAAEQLEKLGVPPDNFLLQRIRLHQGAAAGRMGDYALNRELALAALPVFKGQDAKPELGLVYRNLGYVAMMQGHYDEAKQYGELGVAISREIDDPWMLYMNLANLGYVTFLAGEYDRARQIYDECLPLGDKIGNPYGMAYSRNNLGEVLHAFGAEHEAKRLFEEAYVIFKGINNPRGMAFTINNLGNVAHAMGDYKAALLYNQQSYDLMHEIGDRRGMADALNRLGGVAYSLGEFRQAQQHHRQALAISREIGDRRNAANALVQLGTVLIAEGDYPEAESTFNEAVAIRREMGNPSEIADALQLLGLLASLSGNTDKAPAWLDEAMAVMQSAGVPDPIIMGRDRAFRAVNYLYSQQWQEIKACYGDLLTEFEARGIKWLVLQGNFAMTWAELGLGKLAEARNHAVKSLRMAIDLHTLDWASANITGLANILAAEGQLEHAAELLSFAHDYPISQHFMRQWAAESLAKVRQQLPPDVYAAAVERGKSLQFDEVVAQLLAEPQHRM
jgi:tetratricopeptide (TPR) repeat protein